jgi:type II secretion system protein H
VILFIPEPANPAAFSSKQQSHFFTIQHQKLNIQNPSVTPLTPPFLNPLPPLRPWRPWREQSAFTLVELLAVVGIMGLLAAVAVPALKGLTGSGGRKQALSQLMGALEIARNTAISTGTNAAVIFPDRIFASQPYRYRSMAVITWDATNTNSVTTNSMLGSWITLPQGVVLHDTQINQLPTLTNTTALRIPPSTSPANISNLRAIVFQSDGGLEESYYTSTLTTEGIAFYEGAVVANFTTTTNTSKQETNVETITITHYTGRTIPSLAKPK